KLCEFRRACHALWCVFALNERCHVACVPRRFHEEKAPWRHHERYSPDYEDHGIGDTARRNAGADYLHQFGKGRRTQNMPEDYGTTRTPEPFDRTSYRDEYGRYGERYGEERSRFPGRGWSSGYPGGDRPGWRGDAGMGRAYSG